MYDSNYTTFWERQNYVDSKKISGCPGLQGGREGGIGRAQRISMAAKLLCMILKQWIYIIIHLSKPTEYKIQRVNPMDFG